MGVSDEASEREIKKCTKLLEQAIRVEEELSQLVMFAKNCQRFATMEQLSITFRREHFLSPLPEPTHLVWRCIPRFVKTVLIAQLLDGAIIEAHFIFERYIRLLEERAHLAEHDRHFFQKKLLELKREREPKDLLN